jgi:hypothetical protein
MQISVLKKLLQLISPKNSPEEEKSLEEILEQKPESENEEFEIQNSELEIEDNEVSDNDSEMAFEESTEDEKPLRIEGNRSHLTSSVPRSAKAPQGILTKGELAEIRALFANLDDKEIQRLYKKVTK